VDAVTGFCVLLLKRGILAFALASCGGVLGPAQLARAANPLTGKQVFIDCQAATEQSAPRFNPWYWFHHYQDSDPQKAALLGKIAKVPVAKWFAGDSIRPLPTKLEDRFLARVEDPGLGGPNCETPLGQGEHDEYTGSYPVIAIRAMVHSGCRGYDGGGAWNDPGPNGLYKPWIDAFVKSLGRTWAGPGRFRYRDSGPYPDSDFRAIDRQAMVIIEPDALALMGKISGCLTKTARAHRYALLSYAAQKLGAMPGVMTYIDAGASDWLRVGEAVSMLRKAGVKYVRGFALNATHFEYSKSELRFGNAVAKKLGEHFVVNTAENANGPLPRRFWKSGSVRSKWCNPKNAGLGTQPTTNTGSPYADAFLWISRPGISSNGKNGKSECGRGPLDNVWWEPRALEEARQASFSQPAWPPRPL
jgi:Glycosyl hydrolases family 6